MPSVRASLDAARLAPAEEVPALRESVLAQAAPAAGVTIDRKRPAARLAVDVRALRKRLGLTQEELAHEIGVTVSTMNRWEAGHHAPSRLACRALMALAETRGVA